MTPAETILADSINVAYTRLEAMGTIETHRENVTGLFDSLLEYYFAEPDSIGKAMTMQVWLLRYIETELSKGVGFGKIIPNLVDIGDMDSYINAVEAVIQNVLEYQFISDSSGDSRLVGQITLMQNLRDIFTAMLTIKKICR